MIKTDMNNGFCTEICSSMPYLNIGYQCGTCQVTCPDDETVPCIQGFGLTMFRVDSNGLCEEICILGSTQMDGYSCGSCDSSVPVASPVAPTVRPTRQPAIVPVPVSLPITPVPIPSTIAPVAPATSPTDSGYDITLQLINVSAEDRAVFEAAAALWESAVVGDLPDVDSSSFNTPPFVDGCTYPAVVDDLYICGTMTNIDGVGMIAGQARPTFIRTVDAGRLPSAGEMIFDLADIADLRSKGLTLPLIAHEMGHILGTFVYFHPHMALNSVC